MYATVAYALGSVSFTFASALLGKLDVIQVLSQSMLVVMRSALPPLTSHCSFMLLTSSARPVFPM